MTADDMNSLYVYESKMSLFTRMSQTRVGAEKLLDARLIPILAKCDYLDCRPEADQSFMGMSLSMFVPTVVANMIYRPRFVLTLCSSTVPSAAHASITSCWWATRNFRQQTCDSNETGTF